MKNETDCPSCGRVLKAQIKQYGPRGGRRKVYICNDCGYNVPESSLEQGEREEREIRHKGYDDLRSLNFNKTLEE